MGPGAMTSSAGGTDLSTDAWVGGRSDSPASEGRVTAGSRLAASLAAARALNPERTAGLGREIAAATSATRATVGPSQVSGHPTVTAMGSSPRAAVTMRATQVSSSPRASSGVNIRPEENHRRSAEN